MSQGTMPNLFIFNMFLLFNLFFSCALSFVLMSFFSSLFMLILILVYFFLWQCLFYAFLSLLQCLGCTKNTQKKTRKDENWPLGSASSFSSHYTIGILKKSAAGRRIGYLAHETCKNFLAPLLSKLSAEESWKEKALRTVEAFTQQLTTHNRRPSSTKTNRQLKHIIILAFIAPQAEWGTKNLGVGEAEEEAGGTRTSVKPWGKWGMIWKIDWTSWMDDLFRLIVWPDTSPFPSLSEKTLIQVKVPQVGTVLSPLAEILELELSKTSWSCERTWQCRNATFFEAYLELPWPLHLGLKALKSDMWVLKSHYYIEFWMSSKNHVKHFKKKIVSI